MTRFYITHTDSDGEQHQIGGAYEAETPEAAIALMLTQAGAEDDGNWSAYPVNSKCDIIE